MGTSVSEAAQLFVYLTPQKQQQQQQQKHTTTTEKQQQKTSSNKVDSYCSEIRSKHTEGHDSNSTTQNHAGCNYQGDVNPRISLVTASVCYVPCALPRACARARL